MMQMFRINLPHVFWFLFGCSVLWKVGRLKPDPVAEQVRVIFDGTGRDRRISRSEVRAVIHKEEGIDVDPGGTVGLFPSGSGVVFEIPGEGGGRFVAALMQVWNMLEYWPRKKAALFEKAGIMIHG